MTVTSSASTPARRFRVRLALIAALVMGLSPAGAASAIPNPVTSTGVSFTAALTGDGVLTEGQQLSIALRASNATGIPQAAGGVTIAVADSPLTTREDLRAWLADTDPEPAAHEIGTTTIDRLDAYAQRTLTTGIDPDATGLRQFAPGVYPLTATYASARGDLTAASVLVVPDAAATASVGVIVPITTPARTSGLLTSDELAVSTGAGGDLRGQLDAVTGTAAILAVDPAIVAAIRVLGTSAPDSARAWLADLLALPNERFALQFGDADLGTQVAAGLDAPLSIETLETETATTDAPTEATGSATATPTASPTPTATPTPAATDAPDTTEQTLDELLDIGEAAGSLAWPATGTAGASVVRAISALGTDEDPITTLVPSSVIAGTASGRASADSARLLVYDADVSGALRDVSTSSSSVERGRAKAAASAFTALAAAESPGDDLLVTIDRGSERTAAALRDAVEAGVGLTGRTAVGLTAMLAAEDSDVTLADVDANPTRVAALRELLADQTELETFSSILDDPRVLLGPERTAILQLMGNAWLPDAAGFDAAIAEHRAASRATTEAVSVMQPSGLTLAASSSSLGFTIRNDLPWPVSLVLETTPNDPRVIVQSSTPIKVGASQNTRAEVPIQARVGSGESSLTVELRSPTMIAIGDPVSVDVAVRAEWESIGIVVLGTLVALMIVLGVFRTVVRRRRRRAAEDADG